MTRTDYVTAGLIGVLVSLLVLTTGTAMQARRDQYLAEEAVLAYATALKELATELNQLRSKPIPDPRVVTVTKILPCVEPPAQRVVPVFSRDSRVYAGH